MYNSESYLECIFGIVYEYVKMYGGNFILKIV